MKHLEIEKGKKFLGITLNLGTVKLSLHLRAKPTYPTLGITSRVPHTPYHVIFADYDNILRSIVLQDLKWAIENYHLTPFYVFSTRETYYPDALPEEQYIGNYHAISLTKVTFQEAYEILSQLHVEPNYLKTVLASEYKAWVLRVVPKANLPAPRLITVVMGNKLNIDREISNAHLQFLLKYYQVPIIPYYNPDGSQEVEIVSYVTAKD